MRSKDSAEWILRTMLRILKGVGPKAASRFLDSRGGRARWEAASRELARRTSSCCGSCLNQGNFLFSALSGASHMWYICRVRSLTIILHSAHLYITTIVY